MLKCDFHLHSNVDPHDFWIRHSPFDLIDKAAKLNYDVLCFSHHGEVLFKEEWIKYAQKRNILLIPAAEAFIHKRHVLLINFTPDEAKQCNEWADLKKFCDDSHLIILPHPFFPSAASSMGDVFKHQDCYDALEYNSYFASWWDWNKRGVKASKKLNKPMLANTDCHNLWEFGRVYSLIDAEKNPESIIKAIRSNKVKLHIPPHPTKYFLLRTLGVFIAIAKYSLLRIRK